MNKDELDNYAQSWVVNSPNLSKEQLDIAITITYTLTEYLQYYEYLEEKILSLMSEEYSESTIFINNRSSRPDHYSFDLVLQNINI